MSKVILRLNATLAKTGLSRSVLYSKISKGEFPKQINLSERSIGWIEDELDIDQCAFDVYSEEENMERI